MSRFTDRKNDSRAIRLLREIAETGSAVGTQFEEGSAERSEIDRLRHVIEFVVSCLEASNPDLIAGHLFSRLTERALKVRDLMTMDDSVGNVLLRLKQANDQADYLLADAQTRLPGTLLNFDLGDEKFSQALASFVAQLEAAEQSLGQQVSGMEGRLERDVAQLGQRVQGMASHVSESRGRLDSELAAAKHSLDEAVREGAAREEEFKGERSSRAARLDREMAELRAKFDERASHEAAEARETIDEQLARASDLLVTAADLEARTESLLAGAAAGVAGRAYSGTAARERRTSMRMLIAGGVGFLAVAALAWSAFQWLELPEASSTVELVFFNLTRTAIVGGPAVFATVLIRRSTNHARREVDSEGMANQLATFRPYLAELPEEQRAGMIARMATRFFPGHASVAGADEPDSE